MVDHRPPTAVARWTVKPVSFTESSVNVTTSCQSRHLLLSAASYAPVTLGVMRVREP